MIVGYQRVKASPGDFGIEGFTKDGQTFQCYCPDINEDNKKLHERQRNKITDDLGKLKTNAKELKELLGGVKLKSWILITPTIGHREIINHCNNKRDEVKKWNLPFIDNDAFEVLIHEADDYAKNIGQYFEISGKKLTIRPEDKDSSSERLIEWKEAEIDLVQNAVQKNEIRIKSMATPGNVDKKVNTLTDATIKAYLNGESILRKWQSSQPENHQRFTELIASVEDELRSKCLLAEVEPNAFVIQIETYIADKIKSAFQHLDESTIIRLKNYAVASWLVRCPLYFETESYAD